jgi:hypothetical protein
MQKMILRNSVSGYCFSLLLGAILWALGLAHIHLFAHPFRYWVVVCASIGILVCAIRLFDRSVKLSVDQGGIHDLRLGGPAIPWVMIGDVHLEVSRSLGVVRRAYLKVIMKGGLEIPINIWNLDKEPEYIYQNVTAIWNEARRGSAAPSENPCSRESV